MISHFRKLIHCFIILLITSSCNIDDVIEKEVPHIPIITLDCETGIYSVKVGSELTISPEVQYAEGAIVKWLLDGKIVCRDISYTAVWEEVGEYYLTLSIQNVAGKTEEELKVEVLELTPPIVSLRIPSQGLKVVANTDYEFCPTIQHDNLDNFHIEWIREGKVVSTERKYTFRESELGVYHLTIKASNIDGETIKELDVEVVETMPYSVEFSSPSYFQNTTNRYTFVDRTVYLTPDIEYYDNPIFEWCVNGELVSCAERTFKFTPTASGEYRVKVTVTEDMGSQHSVSSNITRASTSITSEVMVYCVEQDEATLLRSITGNSSKYQNKVYEWTPAPGQFIGETGIGGMTGNETTLEAANLWAENRLKEPNFVSLGGFGGYIIVGFDHSIIKSNLDYDFAIQGNAFNSSNEPGIVWVMQDVNGNGLPDDEWYELRGSETGKEGTIQDYQVTYYKPSGPRMNVEWTDSEGKIGCVDYLESYHRQDYYYPAWIPAEAYKLRGTRLPAINRQDPATGYWSNDAYEWGYADNMGSDRLKGGDTVDGSGQRNGFKISNAMYPDGTPIDLQYIDFIKVQVGVNAKSGWLGEISTEIFGFQDYSMLN